MPVKSSVLPQYSVPPYILSIDIGTTSLRTAVFDISGRLIAGSLARRAVELQTSADGMAVIEAGPLLDSVWNCLDETLAQPWISRGAIAGVGCCTFVSNILGVDQYGSDATPIYTYADTRPAEDAETLKERMDEAVVHQRTGCIFHPSYLPARFVWLQRTQPVSYTRDLSWMSIGEYLVLNLFAETAVSYSAASWSGLLDRFRMDWDEELLSALALDRTQLSGLVDVDHSWIGLREPFASRWPALKDIPWFPAVGDGAAANLGSGCTLPKQVAITMGSTTALRAVLPKHMHTIPTGLWSYLVDRNNSLLGGALSEGGNLFAWLKKTLRFDEGVDFEEVLSAAPVDQHGLTFLPLVAGERSPGWRGDARGWIAGLSLVTRPVDILVAALEGVAYRIGSVYDLLSPALAGEHSVIANGGALVRSPAWVQIIADVLGYVVTLSEVEEASARGAAMLALRSLGIVQDLTAFPAFTGREFTPDPARHKVYQQAKARQQRLYDLI